MAKIDILKKIIAGVKTTFYPLTIPQAVIDPDTKKTQTEVNETITLKADHGYAKGETVKTLKEVDSSLSQKSGASEEEVIATDLNSIAERLSALEKAFRKMELSKIQVDTIDILKEINFQGRPLFVISTGAPAIVPDGVPQFYINTTNGDFYSASNNANVNDWKLK